MYMREEGEREREREREKEREREREIFKASEFDQKFSHIRQ